jgi:hypothetical protein
MEEYIFGGLVLKAVTSSKKKNVTGLLYVQNITIIYYSLLNQIQ